MAITCKTTKATEGLHKKGSSNFSQEPYETKPKMQVY